MHRDFREFGSSGAAWDRQTIVEDTSGDTAKRIVATQPPLLLVSGERDHPALRTDATDPVEVLRRRYTHPDEVELTTVPNLPHPLADEPGLQPAPQLPATKVVDETPTQWFLRQLTAT